MNRNIRSFIFLAIAFVTAVGISYVVRAWYDAMINDTELIDLNVSLITPHTASQVAGISSQDTAGLNILPEEDFALCNTEVQTTCLQECPIESAEEAQCKKYCASLAQTCLADQVELRSKEKAEQELQSNNSHE